jgi:outer membrane lipoprotein LolB
VRLARGALRAAGVSLILAVATALAACISLPPQAADLPPLPPPTTGRLLVKVDAGPQSPAQSVTASFELLGDEHRGQLVLISPLGTRVADARWVPGGVSLGTPEGPRQYPDLAALARDTLGEDVPLGALTHWLAGRPWPGAPATATATGFAQLGWAVDLSRWAEQAQVEARRDQPSAVLVRARIDR